MIDFPLRPAWVLTAFLLMTGLATESGAQSLWTTSGAKVADCAYERGRGEVVQSCVEIDQSVLSDLTALASASFEIPVGNSFVQVAVTSAELTAAGTSIINGHLDGEVFPTFNLAVHEGAAAGSFTFEGALFEVRPTPAGHSVVMQVDKERRRTTIDDAVIPDRMPIMRSSAGRSGKRVSAQIDLLLLWDDDIEASNGSAGLAAIEASFVNYLNQAIANGGNPDITFNVVHSEVVTYDENQFADMADDLGALQENGDGVLDQAHALRAQHGADLVHLLLPSFKQDACGFGYQPITGVDLAFGVTGVDGCGNDTFAHEVGHNMGMGHDIYVTSDPEAAFQLWSHGFVDLDQAVFTVMAYTNECFDNAINCDAVPYFSDPNTLLNGAPLGIPDSPPEMSANNFRVLEEMAENRASFSDLLEACAIALYGADASASTYMQGEEVQLAFQLDNSNGHSGCTSDVSIAAYLMGENLDTYFVGRSSVSLTESIAFYTVSGVVSDPVPPVGTYRVLLYEDGYSGYYDITDAIGLSVEITAGSGVNTEDEALPSSFRLTSAYPNPFNPEAQIAFEVGDTRPVSIRVFDSLGRERAVLADQQVFAAGSHTLRFQAGNLPSGTYLVRMTAGTFSDVMPVTLFK